MHASINIIIDEAGRNVLTWFWPVLVEHDLTTTVLSPATTWPLPISDDDEEDPAPDADGSANNSTGGARS